MIPYATFGLRAIYGIPLGTEPPPEPPPPDPEPSCVWVTGLWKLKSKRGRWCYYSRSVFSSASGCVPSTPKPETQKRERCLS